MALPRLKNLAARPNAKGALDNYRELADGYDASCTRIALWDSAHIKVGRLLGVTIEVTSAPMQALSREAA